jgi:hypothetical protein
MRSDIDGPIDSLSIDESQSTVSRYISTGDGITSIKPYREADGSLWFTVWMDSEIYKRINGRFVVEVNYATRS